MDLSAHLQRTAIAGTVLVRIHYLSQRVISIVMNVESELNLKEVASSLIYAFVSAVLLIRL